MLDVPSRDYVSKISLIVAEIAERHQVTRLIAPHDHLVDSGMTSMAMVDLMLAIEANLDIAIPQNEMTPMNFESIAALSLMVRRIAGDA